MRFLRLHLLIFSVLVGIGGILLASERTHRQSSEREGQWMRPALTVWELRSSREPRGAAPEIPPAINLPVPFTSQAPHGNWKMPYQEACEEAALLMALRYAEGKPIFSQEDANQAILQFVERNREVLGDAIDESVAEGETLLSEVNPKVPVHLLFDPTVSALQQELARGNAIIVPAAGAALQNPHFRRPWPRYHMLVLRGYTEDGHFIANEPGTKEGEGYRYSFATIMDALHDWVPLERDIEEGGKVVLVVEPLQER